MSNCCHPPLHRALEPPWLVSSIQFGGILPNLIQVRNDIAQIQAPQTSQILTEKLLSIRTMSAAVWRDTPSDEGSFDQ